MQNLVGKTAFLNGEQGFGTGWESVLATELKKLGREVILISGLYENPERIIKIKDYDNLVLKSSSNLGKSKLIEAFKKLEYVPKRVVFYHTNTLNAYKDIAIKLSELGTKFYMPIKESFNLEEISIK